MTTSDYVRNGYGCCDHHGHPKILQSKYHTPIRLLSNEEKLVAKSVIDSHANKGIVKNVIETRTGISVSLSACHYLGRLDKDLKKLSEQDEVSSSDRIIQFLKGKKYDYIILYNAMHSINNLSSYDLVSSNYISSKSIQTNTQFEVSPQELIDANQYAFETRQSHNLSNEQNLMVGIACVIPNERRLFHLYPETIFVDCVEDTNNEGRPLLTMAGCDSSNKMFTILRAFLPNQRSWVFGWIFNHVLPTMYSRDTLNNVKVILSDGDSQEYHQIDIAINRFMPDVERVRCSWHVIDRG